MNETVSFQVGGYGYLPGSLHRSRGVAAAPGHRIVHARLRRSAPMAHGFARIAEHLEREGRPLAALCACELRAPAQYSDAGYRAFDDLYGRILQDWNLIEDGHTPVARSIACPVLDAPAEPAVFGFAYTVAADDPRPSAFVSAVSEAPHRLENGEVRAVAQGDTSIEGMRQKARFVADELRRALEALGLDLDDGFSAVQIYTAEPVQPLIADVLAPAGLAANGLMWHFSRPPVEGLSFAMDGRVVEIERLV